MSSDTAHTDSPTTEPQGDNIHPHSHIDGFCPFVERQFGWCPMQEGDYRSPCPALNTLANHGYINRHGRDIEPRRLAQVLREVYGLSGALSRFITYGGIVLLGQFRRISLLDIGRHNLIEHNASLTHLDTLHDGDEYAPHSPSQRLFENVAGTSTDGTHLGLLDLALARVRRESTCRRALSVLHQGIARGEMALILNVFGADIESKSSSPSVSWRPSIFSIRSRSSSSSIQRMIPLNDARTWFLDERLPNSWKPVRKVKIRHLIRDSRLLKSSIAYVRGHFEEIESIRSSSESPRLVSSLNIPGDEENGEGYPQPSISPLLSPASSFFLAAPGPSYTLSPEPESQCLPLPCSQEEVQIKHTTQIQSSSPGSSENSANFTGPIRTKQRRSRLALRSSMPSTVIASVFVNSLAHQSNGHRRPRTIV